MPSHRQSIVQPDSPTHRRSSRGRLAAGLLLVAVMSLGCMMSIRYWSGDRTSGPGESGSPAPRSGNAAADVDRTEAGSHRTPSDDGAVSAPPDRWRAVLRDLDRRRGRAWTLGRPDLLAGVFAPHTAVLRADRTALRRYSRRELSVDGVHLDFGRVRRAGRAAYDVRLLVVDHLRQATVRSEDGWSRRLPTDHPTRHVVTLTRTARGWLISDVRVPA